MIFISDINKDTAQNKNFRKVLFTGKHMQLVVMNLQPGEEIGMEVHNDVDQFFRIEEGSGEAIVDNIKYALVDDTGLIVPAGANHNIINTGAKELKLYTIYTPPNHPDGTVHHTKEEANEAETHH